MTNLEKAKAWFEMESYEVLIDDNTMYVGIDENLMVQITTSEVDWRADLWEEAVDNAQ
jgi:hypothetical protein